MTPGPRRPLGPGPSYLALVALVALEGCVAEIKEERVYGPPRAAAASTVKEEIRQDTWECRSIAITPMIRDVEVRRSFSDASTFGPQATNAGLAFLLGAAAGFIGYDLSALACVQNKDTGCSGQTQAGAASAETLTLGLAAIPLGFLVYNAIRVQDRRSIEHLAPAIAAGEWSACAR